MTQLGDATKPGYSFQGYDGSGFPNQMVEALTAPVRMEVITLGAWLGGWNASPHVRLAIFASDGTLLGETAEFVAANEGAAANGHVSLYTVALGTPVVIDNGESCYVGTIRNRSDAVQWSTGTNANSHFEGTGAYPSGDLASIGSALATVSRRIGAYIANYVPVASAWVRRSGVWVQASDVQVRRSGVWVDADGVEVDRSGAWVDAS